MRSQLLTTRAAALFASDLPTGSRLDRAAADAAIAAAVHACGGARGCVAMMAAAYGDYPETAATRMRWALHVVLVGRETRHPEPDRELVAT